MTADGSLREVAFDIPIERSSWITLRILGSAHTNPIFVSVGEHPIRASKKSVEWCIKAVDQCWSQKERFIKADELEGAKKDYAHAREVYQKILSESQAD